jgi:GT2 family glycosyltransferase
MSTDSIRDSARYREFVARSAADLLEVPDNALSLICGVDFLELGPHLYEKVREGCERFSVPVEQVHDDLVTAREQGRCTWRRRLHFQLVRRVRAFLLALRAAAVALCVVLPLSLLGGRGRSAAGAAARPSGRAADRVEREPPTLSAVVLSFDRLAYLRATLGAFVDRTDLSRCELIAVDHGSQDGSAEFLREAHRRGVVSKLVLRAANYGTSAGYNYGFALADAGSEFLMKLDSDIEILSDGWLEEAVDFLRRNERVGFVALNQVNHTYLRVLPSQRVGGVEVMRFGDWPCGSAMIVRRRVRDEVGCFVEDPALPYAPDDVDYFARVSRKGHQALFLRNTRARHQVHLDWSRYRAQRRANPVARSAGLALQLARDYDRGARPLTIHYEQYGKIELPDDGLIVEKG